MLTEQLIERARNPQVGDSWAGRAGIIGIIVTDVTEKEVVVENLVDGSSFRVSRSLTEYARRAEFYVREGLGFVPAGGFGTPGGAE